MGGFGSGRYYRRSARTTCEEVKRIDIRYLRKQSMLRPNTTGSLSWNIGGEPSGNINYTMHENTMILNFRYRQYGDDEWESVQQTIWFDRTPCHYGGSRKWFLCPHCDRRIAVLYMVDTRFYCRHCGRLPYASQGEDYLDRMSRKFDKLSKRLEADEYIVDGDLWKPKGMHWKTFYHLKMAEIDADERSANAFLARFGAWL
jgi:hypothetical protein